MGDKKLYHKKRTIVIKQKVWQVWSPSLILKLGLRFLMNRISKTKQLNFPWHLLKTLNWFSFKRYCTVSFHKMLTDCRIFVLSNALMKVSRCGPDIIYITQIT